MVICLDQNVSFWQRMKCNAFLFFIFKLQSTVVNMAKGQTNVAGLTIAGVSLIEKYYFLHLNILWHLISLCVPLKSLLLKKMRGASFVRKTNWTKKLNLSDIKKQAKKGKNQTCPINKGKKRKGIPGGKTRSVRSRKNRTKKKETNKPVLSKKGAKKKKKIESVR